MLDIRLLREQSQNIQNALSRKGVASDIVSNLLRIDENRRELMTRRDELRARQNIESKRIPTLSGEEKIWHFPK